MRYEEVKQSSDRRGRDTDPGSLDHTPVQVLLELNLEKRSRLLTGREWMKREEEEEDR